MTKQKTIKAWAIIKDGKFIIHNLHSAFSIFKIKIDAEGYADSDERVVRVEIKKLK